MTTSAIYEQAAIQFEAAADETLNLNRSIESIAVEAPLVSGRLGYTVQSMVIESGEQVRFVGGQLADLASVAISRSRSGPDGFLV